jgi:hypothetical protein
MGVESKIIDSGELSQVLEEIARTEIVLLKYFKEGIGPCYRVGFVSAIEGQTLVLADHYEPPPAFSHVVHSLPMPPDYKTTRIPLDNVHGIQVYNANAPRRDFQVRRQLPATTS